MNLAQFFSKSTFSFFSDSHSVIYFKGSETAYPLLFFSMLFNHLKKTTDIPLSYIDLSQEDFNSIQSKLETTFLGQKTFFWLKSIVELDEKKRKQIKLYLDQYQGPNTIAVFVPLEMQLVQDAAEIIIDPLIDKKTFAQL